MRTIEIAYIFILCSTITLSKFGLSDDTAAIGDKPYVPDIPEQVHDKNEATEVVDTITSEAKVDSHMNTGRHETNTEDKSRITPVNETNLQGHKKESHVGTIGNGTSFEDIRLEMLKLYHLENCTESGGVVAKFSSIKYCYLGDEVQFCMCPLDLFVTMEIKSIFTVTLDMYKPFFAEKACVFRERKYNQKENVLLIVEDASENDVK